MTKCSNIIHVFWNKYFIKSWKQNYENNNTNLCYYMQVYVSYVHTKLQWIYPVSYADLGFQLMPLQCKMAALIRGLKGGHFFIMVYFIPSERTWFIGDMCVISSVCIQLMSYNSLLKCSQTLTSFFYNTVISPNWLRLFRRSRLFLNQMH